MLIEFTVGNYRSIADKVTLSMIAAPIKSGSHAASLDSDNLIYVDDKLSLLKTVAIYGANASGKSNLLKALIAMGSYIHLSIIAGELGLELRVNNISPYEPFLLRENGADEPCHFEIVFLLEGKQYRYGFEISASRVEKEWLYFIPNTREALLFEREGDKIKIGEMFKGAKGLEARVARRSLFLTVAFQFNVKIAADIFVWLDRFPAMSSELHENLNTIWCLEDREAQLGIIEFIRQLDIGISGIEVTAKTENNGNSGNKNEEKSDQKSYRVETIHKIYDNVGNPVGTTKLDLHRHESEGTQKLFAMVGKIMTVLKNGHILAIDEIDAKLHPALTRRIVELFHSPGTNPHNAQLIFATHDTNLLDNRLMRRDQIWFAEKKRNGATDLYSLVELKVRNDASYETDYIEGRYGAIPFPGGFTNLFSSVEENYADSK